MSIEEIHIKKLEKAGLFGHDLVVLSPSLIKRYNEALAILGVKPTRLKKISIDGLGWSPEVSKEKENPYYLTIGDANTNAILVSPQQENKPVYMPFHSFDRDLMTTVFAAYRKEIHDITKDSAICINFDQHIDTYYQAYDLLGYNQITISFLITNRLDEKQKEQQQLIKEFYKNNNFIDTTLHDKIIASAKTYGDLRARKLQLEPIQVPIGSFYTKAFGGVFVLKDFIKEIIVFEDEEMFKKAIRDTVHDVLIFHKNHDELIQVLNNHIITELKIKKATKTARYKRIKNHVFVSVLKSIEHPVNEILSNTFLYKKYLNLLDTQTRKRVMSVELYNQRKIIERDLTISETVDKQYIKALQEPHSSLEEEHQEIVWKLLTQIAPIDPVHLYWYSKEDFYKNFKTWRNGYQDWVISCILDNNKTT